MIRSASTLLAMLALSSSALAAPVVVGTYPEGDVVVGPDDANIDLPTGNLDQPVTGVALTAQWRAVVADEENGVRPWSIDLSLTAESGSSTLLWADPIGGDVTIADYPLLDFSPSTFSTPLDLTEGGVVTFVINSGNPAPFVVSLDGLTLYLTADGPDVVESRTGIANNPSQMWSRPFFIEGISGQGPVSYEVIPFQVSVSGGYTFDSIVEEGNNFTYLYRGSFDPSQPLENLADYSLGNGFGPFDLPQGQSRIDALLLEGETYYFVTSQWASFSTPSPYALTITGPALIEALRPVCPGNVDGDDIVGLADLNAVLAAFGTSVPMGTATDLDGSGTVDLPDLNILLGNFGAACP